MSLILGGIVSSYIQGKALQKIIGISDISDINLHKTIIAGLYNLIELVSTTKKLEHNDFNTVLSELDLDFKLELIQGFLDDIGIIFNHSNEKRMSKTILTSLNYLNNIITNIHILINTIKEKIEYHKTKYFNYYRTLDISQDILSLKQNHNLLLSRFDLIIKIFNFK